MLFDINDIRIDTNRPLKVLVNSKPITIPIMGKQKNIFLRRDNKLRTNTFIIYLRIDRRSIKRDITEVASEYIGNLLDNDFGLGIDFPIPDDKYRVEIDTELSQVNITSEVFDILLEKVYKEGINDLKISFNDGDNILSINQLDAVKIRNYLNDYLLDTYLSMSLDILKRLKNSNRNELVHYNTFREILVPLFFETKFIICPFLSNPIIRKDLEKSYLFDISDNNYIQCGGISVRLALVNDLCRALNMKPMLIQPLTVYAILSGFISVNYPGADRFNYYPNDTNLPVLRNMDPVKFEESNNEAHYTKQSSLLPFARIPRQRQIDALNELMKATIVYKPEEGGIENA